MLINEWMDRWMDRRTDGHINGVGLVATLLFFVLMSGNRPSHPTQEFF